MQTHSGRLFGRRGRRGLFSRRSPLIDVAQFLLLSGFLVWLLVHGAQALDYNWQWVRVPRYLYQVVDGHLVWGRLTRGLFVTLHLTGWSVLLALAAGVVTALLRMTTSFSGQLLARVYLQLIRNTPLLVQVFVLYFVVSPIIGVSRFWTGVIAIGLYEGAFASEIIRAGILSVPRGQWEAADSVGITTADKYRFIIFPQAIPLMLPPLTGSLVNLIKNSAIVSVIAVADLTTAGRNIIADTFMSFEIWFTVAAIYLVLTTSLSIVVAHLERRVQRRA